jgi:hypothetical protein
MAVADNQILVSEDGAGFVILFDAKFGAWPGSGFFTRFPSEKLFEANPGTIRNNYLDDSALVVSQSVSTSNCEYFTGVGTICGGDADENLTVREYYKESIGPVGYYKYSAYSALSGFDGWSSSSKVEVGLVACSLRGDAVDYGWEHEPNDSPAEATPVTWRESRGVAKSSDDTQSPTEVSLARIDEVEPNDRFVDAQILPGPCVLDGESTGWRDMATVVRFLYRSRIYLREVQDWYAFDLSARTRVRVAFSYTSNVSALYWLYIFRDDYTTEFSSPPVMDESDENDMSLDVTLEPGRYFVAPAVRPPDARERSWSATYTLSLTYGDNEPVRQIEDWYTFSLDTVRPVQIRLFYENEEDGIYNNMDLFLIDDSGATVVASSTMPTSQPERIEATLGAGTYFVGVDVVGTDAKEAYTLIVE